ncbi:MAG: carbon-nitrogen hydrolase family protein [Pseudomonadota bacterium]
MKIAAAAYRMEELPSLEAYAEKLESWVAGADADLLVFPEYAAMELATITGRAGDLQAAIDAVSELQDEVAAIHVHLAHRYDRYILAASGPVRAGGRTVNRARLFGPAGDHVAQDKQIMTRFERETWGISPGGPLEVIETPHATVGILICYDAEFPLLARALSEAGADVLLVPSCTDRRQGWSRVRVGAMARALENQCITVQAPTVGDCPWCAAVDENYGSAAIYAPPDGAFPDSGILSESLADTPGWARAEIDMEGLRRVRQTGSQLNASDWSAQTPRLTALSRSALG